MNGDPTLSQLLYGHKTIQPSQFLPQQRPDLADVNFKRTGTLEGPVSAQEALDYDALKQGFWHLQGNALAQLTSKFITGTIEGTSYLLNMEAYVDLMEKGEANFTNWLSEMMQSVDEDVREAFPIKTTQDAAENFRPWDKTWWASNQPSFGTTLSLLLPAVGTVSAVSRIGKALGAGSRFLIKPASQLGAKSVTGAVASRIMENSMEAAQTYDQSYETLIQKGLSHEYATEQAGEAASNVWLTNSANLIWDIGQFGLLFKEGRRLINHLSSAPKTIKYGTAALTEGTEEFFQGITQEEAIGAAQGRFSYFGDNFGERLSSKYLSDGKLYTGAFFGALGGTVFQAVGSKIADQFDPETGQPLAPVPEKNDELTTRSVDVAAETGVQAPLAQEKFNDDVITSMVYNYRTNNRTSEELIRDLEQNYRQEVPRVAELGKKLESIYDSIKETNPDLKREIFNIKAKALTVNDSLTRVNKAVEELTNTITSTNQGDSSQVFQSIIRNSLSYINNLKPNNEEERAAIEELKTELKSAIVKTPKLVSSFDEQLVDLSNILANTQIEKKIIDKRLKEVSSKSGISTLQEVLDKMREEDERLQREEQIEKVEKAETPKEIAKADPEIVESVVEKQEKTIDTTDIIEQKNPKVESFLNLLRIKYDGNVAMLDHHLRELGVTSMTELAEKYVTDPEFNKKAKEFYSSLVKPENVDVIVDHEFTVNQVSEIDRELALRDKSDYFPFASITKDKKMFKAETRNDGTVVWETFRGDDKLPQDDLQGRDYMKESDFNALRDGKIKPGQIVHYEVNPLNQYNYRPTTTSENFQVLEVVYLDNNKENKSDENRIVVGQFKSNLATNLGDEERIIMGDLRFNIWNEWNKSKEPFTASFTGFVKTLWPGRFWNLPTLSRAADAIENLEVAVGYTNEGGTGLLFDDRHREPEDVHKPRQIISGGVYALLNAPNGLRIPYRLHTAKIKDVPVYQERIRAILADNPSVSKLRKYVSIKEYELSSMMTPEQLYQSLDIDNRVAQVDYRSINKIVTENDEWISYNKWLSDIGVLWTNINPKQHFHSQRITLDPYGYEPATLPKAEVKEEAKPKELPDLFYSEGDVSNLDRVTQRQIYNRRIKNIDNKDILRETDSKSIIGKLDKSKLSKEQKVLLKLLENLNINVSILPKDKYFGSVVYGYYRTANNTIYLPESFTVSSFLHELLHGLIVPSYFTDETFKTELDSKFREVRRRLLDSTDPFFSAYQELVATGSTYGLTDVNEFISELFANPEFGKIVGSLQLDSANSFVEDNTTRYTGIKFIDWLIDAIVRLFDRRFSKTILDEWSTYILKNEDLLKKSIRESFDTDEIFAREADNIYDEFTVSEIEKAARLSSRVFNGYVGKLAKENNLEKEEAYRIALSNNIQQNLVLSKEMDSVYSFFESHARINEKAAKLLKYINNESEFYKIVLDKISRRGINVKIDLEQSEDKTREFYAVEEAFISPEERLSSRLKSLFSDIENPGSTGFLPKFPDYLDGNYVFGYILENVTEVYSESAMMDRLKELVTSQPWLQTVVDQLESNQEIRTQMFTISQQNSPDPKIITVSRRGDVRFINATDRRIVNQVVSDIKRGIEINNIDAVKAKELLDKNLSNVNYLKELGIQIQGQIGGKKEIKELLSDIASGKDIYISKGSLNNLFRLAKIIKRTYPSYYVPTFVNVENELEFIHKRANFLNRKLSLYKEGKSKYDIDPLYAGLPFFTDLKQSSEFIEYASLNGLRVAGVGGIKYESMSKGDFILSMLSAYINNGSTIGFFGFPIFSDAAGYGFLSMKKLEFEDSINRIYMTARNELRRQEHPAHKRPNYRMFSYITNISDSATSKTQIREHLIQMTDQLATEINRLHITKSPIRDKETLKKFVANDQLVQSQLILAFSGDPAFYSNTSDFYKRNKQIYSPVTYGNVDAQYTDEQGTEHEVSPTYRVKYLDIPERASLDYESIENIIGNKAKRYLQIPEADSQSWIDPYRFREEEIMLGRWTHKKEKAYQRVIQGKESEQDIRDVFKVVKSFVYGIVRQGDLIHPMEHKMSEYVLIPSYAKKHPELKKMMQEMGYEFTEGISLNLDNRDVDQFIASTAVKVGLYGDYHTVPNSIWGLQQETPIKTKEISEGTQQKKLIQTNGDPEDVQKYNDLLIEDYKSRWSKFSFANFKEQIRDHMRRVNAPEDEIRAVETLPLYLPIHSDSIENIANSIPRNRFTINKKRGASLYNASSYGIENPPRMIFDESGNFLYAEAYADLPVGTEGIAYRIPTEGFKSMFRVKVVGNHPGNGAIILPEELVIMTDFDFDIDKTNVEIFETEDRSSIDDRILSLKLNMLQKRQSEQLTPGGFRRFISIVDSLVPLMEEVDILDINTRAEMVKRYNDARILIGAIANVNAAFPAFQKFGKLELDTQIKFNGKVYSKIGGSVDAEGNLVSDNLSELAGASVDDRNEPRMSRVNINKHTIDVVTMLLLARIPLPWAIKFINQPILHQYIEDVRSLGEEVANARYRKRGLITKEGVIDISDFDNVPEQVALTNFLTYKTQARDLTNLVLLTQRSDNGLSDSISANKLLINRRSNSENLKIVNAYEFLHDKSIANNILFDLGILEAHNKVVQQINSPVNNEAFLEMQRYFDALADRQLFTSELDHINKNFMSFLTSKQVRREKIFEIYKTLPDNIPNLDDYPYTKSVIKIEGGLLKKQFNPDKVRAALVRREIEHMWRNGSDQHRKLAADLFYYSFLQSGITYSPNSITNLIPYPMWEVLDFNSLINEESKVIKPEHHNFMEQYISNFFPRLRYIPLVDNFKDVESLYVKTNIDSTWQLYKRTDNGYIEIKPKNDYNQNQYWNYYRFPDHIGTSTVKPKPKPVAPEDPKVSKLLETKQTKEDISAIYSKLGDKTKSENVRIERWDVLKNEKDALIKVYNVVASIVSTRIFNSDRHFGNPFSSDKRVLAQNPSLIETSSTKESVEKYIDWVINSNDSRAQWIRGLLQTGELKDKPILYYKELGEPSHATALDYLINKYKFGKSIDLPPGIEIEPEC